MSMGLPIYEMAISEDLSSDLQVEFVALVDKPAIEKNFIAFKEHQSFAAIDEQRYIISGAAMLANVPIYRKDDSIGEYYVVFKPDTIYEIAQKFFAKGYANNFNLMHDAQMQVQGVTVFESFISDSTRGISPMKGFEDAQDGSWFISAKVNNMQVWDLIKQGKVKGFSVEGMFQYKKELSKAEAQMNQVYSILNGITK